MSNYICIITSGNTEKGEKISGNSIYKDLMDKKVWGLHPRTVQRAKIVEGDRLVFYVGGDEQYFAGTAIASASPFKDENFAFNNPLMMRLDLKDIHIFDRPKPIKPLLSKLSFIKNPIHWGPYLQGGVRKVNNTDFETIITSEDYRVDVLQERDEIKNFIETIDFQTINFNPHTLGNPDRITISSIIENLDSRWAIPNFQRYFDWNREDVRALLESIFNDYYVGAFLLWESDERSPLSLIATQGSDNELKNIEYIILDGQQRCTALYYAIKSPDFALRGTSKNSYYYIDFKDYLKEQNSEQVIVVKDREISEEETFDELLFPLNKLPDFRTWIRGLEDYFYKLETQVSHENVRDLGRLIEDRLRHMWSGFQIPYVVLPRTMDLSQVSIIFERINTKGKLLSTFDLLIAKLLRNEVDLRNLWEQTESEKEKIATYVQKIEKIKIYLFQSLSLRHHSASSTKKKDILSLYENLSLSSADEFIEYWTRVVNQLEDTLDILENLRTGYGVLNEGEVPFAPMIPVLTALMMDVEGRPNSAQCNNKISQWYWSAVFTNAYSSAAESQMTTDYREVVNWFDDDLAIPKVVNQARNEVDSLDLKDINNHSNAIYRGVLSLIALAGAIDFETSHALEVARENEKDHIFPKSPSSGFSEHPYINSVLNMTWLSKPTNLRKTDKKPSIYIPEFIKEKFNGNEDEFIGVLRSHIINDSARKHLINDDFDTFLEEREKNIKRVIRTRIGLSPGTEEILEEAPEGAVDSLEVRLRDFLDRFLTEKKGEGYWKSHTSSGVQQRAKIKIDQRFRRHPSENKELSDRNYLDYCDVMDYQEIISVNWDVFERVFGSRGELEKHFLQLKEYRNALKHGRAMNNVERKQGEASFEWLSSILDSQTA